MTSNFITFRHKVAVASFKYFQRSFRLAGIILVCFTYLGALLLSAKLMVRPTISFDEAGQFLIAKGKFHYGNWDMPEGGVDDVLYYNARYNLDPGGYGVFLHFWTMINTSSFWLKLPSFLLLWIVSACMILYFRKQSEGWLTPLLAGLIPFLLTPVFLLSLQVRAYGAEFAGTMIALLLVNDTRANCKFSFYLLTGFLLAIMCTMRYSSLMIALMVLVVLLLQPEFRRATILSRKLAVIAPVLIALIGVYFITFSVQNSELSTRANGPYLSENPEMLFTSTLNLMFLIGLAILAVVAYKSENGKLRSHLDLFRLTLLVNGGYILLSFAGLHPWSVTDQHLASGVLLMVLSLWTIASSYLDPLERRKFGYLLAPVSAVLLVIFLYSQRDRIMAPLHQKDVYHELVKADFSGYNKVFVGFELATVFNYHYNYGTLKGELPDDFLNKFHLDKGIEHRNRSVRQLYRIIHEEKGNLDHLIDQGYDLRITNPWSYPSGANDRWVLIRGSKYFYHPKIQFVEP